MRRFTELFSLIQLRTLWTGGRYDSESFLRLIHILKLYWLVLVVKVKFGGVPIC